MTPILNGVEIDPRVLLDVDYVCEFQIVGPEVRIEKLEGEANVQEQGA